MPNVVGQKGFALSTLVDNLRFRLEAEAYPGADLLASETYATQASETISSVKRWYRTKSRRIGF
jgi:hypothetical protein